MLLPLLHSRTRPLQQEKKIKMINKEERRKEMKQRRRRIPQASERILFKNEPVDALWCR